MNNQELTAFSIDLLRLIKKFICVLEQVIAHFKLFDLHIDLPICLSIIYLVHKEKYTHTQTSSTTIASDLLPVCQAGHAKLSPAGSILTF